MKACGAAVVGISTYLLIYFFIYTEGCEELVKFWVLANLIISISFTALRMFFVLVKEGKEGLKRALTKHAIKDHSLSFQNQSSGSGLQLQYETFKLADDFYSVAFYSYILM